jgi:hypothetical protein
MARLWPGHRPGASPLAFALDQAAAVPLAVSRLRATRPAAPRPNNSTIGGAGTSAGGPPLEPVDPLLVPELVELVMPLDVLQPMLLEP